MTGFPTRSRPCYASGFARNAAESAYPELWRGLTAAWVPAMGITGPNIKDLSGHNSEAVTSGAVWNAIGGPALELDTLLNDFQSMVPDASRILTARNTTIISHYEKIDGTARQSGAWGVSGTTDAHRCGCHLPWDDGTAYFDYGGQTGNNRVAIAGLTFGAISASSRLSRSGRPV